jgi:hypothetical protein
MTKYKEIDIFKFDVKTDFSDMTIDSRTKDMNVILKELENLGYSKDRIKSIKFRTKDKGLVRE